MKNSLLTLGCIFSAIFSYSQSLSNEVIGASGNHSASANYDLSWTSGEPVITTATGTNHILTQGFHQPEINLSGLPDQPDEAALQVYPVPTEGWINISFNGLPRGEYTLTLHDIEGRALLNTLIVPNSDAYIHTLDISSLAAATYVVTIVSPDIHKSFRVIKNNR